MRDIELKITIGGLLHDIGKVLYREGTDKKTHSQIGYEFLKNELKFEDSSILDCVRYHHKDAIRNATLEENSLAFIVYIADNIASSIDRRDKEIAESGFEIHTPLQPVFNLLNGNKSYKYYNPLHYNVEDVINYPIDDKNLFTKEQYAEIVRNLTDNLKGIDFSAEYINSLLEVMEANLSYIPSSTAKGEVPDISLFDHLRVTAALSVCLLQYLEEHNIENFKNELLKNESSFYSKKAFIIASIDLSGIQKFIYTIQSKDALKNLRARSFYLEILMEHMIDELLLRLSLSRCNLLYAGGGHCYLVLPNTDKAKKIFDEFIAEVNDWFLEKFDIELYAAGGYAECSADDLKNEPKGSYENIFRTMSGKISEIKLKRYSAKTIKILNNSIADDYSRECSVCKKVAHVNDDGLCPLCRALGDFSKNVLYSDFFTVLKDEEEQKLPLPGGYSLTWDDEKSLKKRMETDERFVRSYSKNKSYTGKHIATKLWVGNYSSRATFEEFANESKGIKRVGIFRADVDNLGQAFVNGFRNKENEDRYVTISRTATLSRQLSLFFKLHINKILNNSQFSLDGNTKEKRNITIVYSGGDDIFVVGSWNEVIEFSIDLRNSFKNYCEDTLTISAGIGLYDAGYPISSSSMEVEELVDDSKSLPTKNAITLLPDGETHSINQNEEDGTVSDGTYGWDELINEVIGEKFVEIRDYMDMSNNQYGNSLLYRILELVRKLDYKINFARLVYLIARLEPEEKASEEVKEKFHEFAGKMLKWIKNERDCRHLKTAIELYVYLNRAEDEE